MYISGNTNITENFNSQNIKKTYYNLYFKMSVSSIKREREPEPEEQNKKLPTVLPVSIQKFVSEVIYLLSRDTPIALSIASQLEISPEQNAKWYIRDNTFDNKNKNLYHGIIYTYNNDIILNIKMLGLRIVFKYSGEILLQYYDNIMWPFKETINITDLSYISIVEYISQAYKTHNSLSRQLPSVWTRQDHTTRPSVLSDREQLQDSVVNCLRTGVEPRDTRPHLPLSKRVKMYSSSSIDDIDKTDTQQFILRNRLLESSLISKQHKQDARSIIETQPRPPPSLCDSNIANLHEITPDVNVMHLDKLHTDNKHNSTMKKIHPDNIIAIEETKKNKNNMFLKLFNLVLNQHMSTTNTMSIQQHMAFTQHMTSIFNIVFTESISESTS